MSHMTLFSKIAPNPTNHSPENFRNRDVFLILDNRGLHMSSLEVQIFILIYQVCFLGGLPGNLIQGKSLGRCLREMLKDCYGELGRTRNTLRCWC